MYTWRQGILIAQFIEYEKLLSFNASMGFELEGRYLHLSLTLFEESLDTKRLQKSITTVMFTITLTWTETMRGANGPPAGRPHLDLVPNSRSHESETGTSNHEDNNLSMNKGNPKDLASPSGVLVAVLVYVTLC